MVGQVGGGVELFVLLSPCVRPSGGFCSIKSRVEEWGYEYGCILKHYMWYGGTWLLSA